MSDALQRWLSLRIADVMSREVVRISACQTMAEAAEVLSRENIRGLPVVNEFDQCIGMLSTSDFAKGTHPAQETDTLSTPAGEFELVQSETGGPMHIEHVSEELVSEHMSCGLQTIAADRTLLDAARTMEAQHIHRLVVVDGSARPVGVVSCLDLVAALTKSIEEQRANPSGIPH